MLDQIDADNNDDKLNQKLNNQDNFSRLVNKKPLRSNRFLFLIISLVGVGVFIVIVIVVLNNAKQNNSIINSEKDLQVLIKIIIQPFDGSKPFTNTSRKEMHSQYQLKALINCYLQDVSQKDTETYKKLQQFNSNQNIKWDEYKYEGQGYYETDTCFAAYINPDIGFRVNNVNEASNFGEMVIRRVFGRRIRSRVDYKSSENVQTLSLKTNPQFGFPADKADTLFGFYNERTDMVYINIDSAATKKDIAWRLWHEQLHAFSSKTLTSPLIISLSNTSPLEETITEHLNDVIANKMDGKIKYSPAMQELLKYIDEETLEDIYFNKSFLDLKGIIDAKTYDGALCTFAYNLDRIDPYGHVESSMWKDSLENSNTKVPDGTCIF